MKISAKKFSIDMIYSILALVLMNGVLQLLIYPYINKTLGEDAFGSAVYALGIVSIISVAVGTAACNTRIITKNSYHTSNSDYYIFLIIAGGLASLIGTLLVAKEFSSVFDCILFYILAFLTVLRVYALVEFRIILNFKGYLIYYAVLSIGYILGAVLFSLVKLWQAIFIVGELAALIYVFIVGKIFKPDSRSENFGKANKAIIILFLSLLVQEALMQVDKLILMNISGSSAVSQYYAASLLGKTLVFLASPLSVVILSYISGKNSDGKKQTLICFLCSIILGGFFFAACYFLSPVFLRIWYPDLAITAVPLSQIATPAWIFFFSSNILMTIVLASHGEKTHFIIQICYGVLCVGLSIPMTIRGGVNGFSYAVLISNAFRYALTVIVGLFIKSKASINLN